MTLVLRGFLVNASNPKAVIFMLAVLPQFIDPHQPLLAQYLIMGGTMIVVDLIVMAGYTGLAARVLRVLRSPRQQKLVNRTFASLFVGAAGCWRRYAERRSEPPDTPTGVIVTEYFLHGREGEGTI